MTQYYYVGADNQSHGPITPDQFLAHGLTPGSMICPVGGGNWVALSTQPELLPYLQPGYSALCEENQLNGSQEQLVKPSNKLGLAILVTIFCCLPFGIVAIVKASKVNGLWEAGKYCSARQAAADAKKWCIISAVLGVLSAFMYNWIYFR